MLFGDEKLTMTFKEYRKKNRRAGNQEAYARALERIKEAKLGMKFDPDFLAAMKNLYIGNEDGERIDGFIEGCLALEGRKMMMKRRKKNEAIFVFGYYKNWKMKRGPVKKFYVVFRHDTLWEIGFFDPKEDKWSISGMMK